MHLVHSVSTLALALTLAACGTDAVTGGDTPGDLTNPGPTNPGTTQPAPAGLRTASTHPIQYYVSLPKNWSAARTWPVVVTIAGSGGEFPENHAAFSAERDSRQYPFIVVTPLTLTNGGGNVRNSSALHYSSETWARVEREGRCLFDLDGIRAAVADVARLYNGQSKFFMTGFSGGGHTLGAMLLLHPEVLRTAAPVAGNYGGRCVTGQNLESPYDDPVPHPVSQAPERVNLPVRSFNGANDANPYLLPQRDSLFAIARRNGYGNLSSNIVPNASHEPMPSQTLAFFFSQLTSSER
jgi:poly(3-hydroxybutyrate) depolymerase